MCAGERLLCAGDRLLCRCAHVSASCVHLCAEFLTPPVLAAVCNGSEEARLRWEMRSHFYHSFQYELQINKVPGAALSPPCCCAEFSPGCCAQSSPPQGAALSPPEC